MRNNVTDFNSLINNKIHEFSALPLEKREKIGRNKSFRYKYIDWLISREFHTLKDTIKEAYGIANADITFSLTTRLKDYLCALPQAIFEKVSQIMVSELGNYVIFSQDSHKNNQYGFDIEKMESCLIRSYNILLANIHRKPERHYSVFSDTFKNVSGIYIYEQLRIARELDYPEINTSVDMETAHNVYDKYLGDWLDFEKGL